MLHLTLTCTETSKTASWASQRHISVSAVSPSLIRRSYGSPESAPLFVPGISMPRRCGARTTAMGVAQSRGDTTATASAQTRSQYPYSIPLRADLAELLDWLEGVSTAAQQARDKGNITLAEALENTRFEVYG